MISIDTVYQRVLAVLNKEQRGYITPQEFNLKANQAQLEIFEQYFYDLQQFKRVRENNTEYSNMIKLIDEKISKFKKKSDLTFSSNYFTFPADLHKIGTVIYNNIEVERIDAKEALAYELTPLGAATVSRPTYVQNIENTEDTWGIKIYPSSIVSGVSATYIRKPATVNWAYTEVDGNPLYNANNSINFELHDSDEPTLVIKILAYSGVIVREFDITEVANAQEAKTITQEKS